MTKKHCIPIFEQFWGEFEEYGDLNEEEEWHQQEGALYTAKVTMAWLCETFREHFIGHKVEWAPYLLDLTAKDFFLRAFSKTISTKATIAGLKTLRRFKLSPRRNVHILSTNLHNAFNRAFY